MLISLSSVHACMYVSSEFADNNYECAIYYYIALENYEEAMASIWSI